MWLELRSSSGVFLGASRRMRIGGCVATEYSVEADAGLVLSRGVRARNGRSDVARRDIATPAIKRKARAHAIVDDGKTSLTLCLRGRGLYG